MADRKETDFLGLLMPTGLQGEQAVFEDEQFKRQVLHTKIDPAIDADIIIDWPDAGTVACCHISLACDRHRSLDFVIHNAQHVSHSQGRLITHSPDSLLLWMPKDPVSRVYDDNGRIESTTESPFEVNCNHSSVRMTVEISPGRKTELAVVIFKTGVETFTREILDCSPIELRKVVRSNWFYYEGVKNVWDYFVNGVFFSCRHKVDKKAWPGQNIPFALYHYLDFLHKRTKKQIYRLLCDLIAYSVMLSLPDNGRWRHGTWTDIIETHMVHQVAGINIFLSYYKRTARSIFLEKAKKAMDYLLSIADDFSETETWFLHDSLETNWADAILFYDLFDSAAFGKSRSNTLCINSHINTLTALHELNRIEPSDKYSACFEKGLSALKKVLNANPCGFLYWSVYRLRDFLMRLCMKTENIVAKKLNKVWTLVLRKHLLPFLKKRFPRLVMPNGFIERDLSYSAMSDFYHFRNIEDILILYNLTRDDRLFDIVKKSVKYTVDSGLVEYVVSRNPKAILFLDIILLYSDLIDPCYLPLLPGYLADFQKANSAVPVNILSDPFITNSSSPLYIDNENIIVLAPAAGKNFRAVLLNPTDKDRKVMVKSAHPADINEMEVVDSDNRKFSIAGEIMVPKMSFVKVVSKNG
ncbi:MAG: D-glucuronyl C5-epimerase family protein [Planctomycetota bacterium]|jgi:hypothetical protein